MGIKRAFDFPNNQDAASARFLNKRSKKGSLFLFAHVLPPPPASFGLRFRMDSTGANELIR
jgi:hypothetical protein